MTTNVISKWKGSKMGETRHTPGPWHLCQHLKSMECDAACPCGYRGVVFGPDRDTAFAICQPGHELPRREEEWGSEPPRYPRDVELANMRLVAASPDLLDALIEAQDIIRSCVPGNGWRGTRKRIADAIAKATAPATASL